jgi:asparagine synthase (glutamine-hydrolysing)
MWHSLELHGLVEMAAAMPARLKLRGWKQKYLLKKLAERWLDPDVIYHRKQGFEAPMGPWLRGPLLPYFDSVVSQHKVNAAGFLNYGAIKQLRDAHESGREKNSKILFAILMCQLWHARFG